MPSVYQSISFHRAEIHRIAGCAYLLPRLNSDVLGDHLSSRTTVELGIESPDTSFTPHSELLIEVNVFSDCAESPCVVIFAKLGSAGTENLQQAMERKLSEVFSRNQV
jgi:hypothetical protein